MKKPQTLSLKQWGNKFSVEQKRKAKKANNYYAVVKEFKEIRKELGFTQKDVADRAGIDRSFVAKLESGSRNTTIESLQMLAEAIDKKLKISFV